MSSKNDGGPAFPLQSLAAHDSEIAWGMSLRDWFAGQALMGWAAGRQGPMMDDTNRESAVVEAYKYADAMLRAREKSQAPSASGASGGSCNPHDAASPYAGPVIFDGNAKGPQ